MHMSLSSDSKEKLTTGVKGDEAADKAKKKMSSCEEYIKNTGNQNNEDSMNHAIITWC